jgi:hypothetical protein
MKELKIAELNKLFDEAEEADRKIFAEMRSNIRLSSGEHYKAIQDRLIERIESSRANEAIKLKLTKNHIQVVTKTYINNIVAGTPGVRVEPFNGKELQDIKDADISQAVWSDAEVKQRIAEKIERWASQFVIVGEIAAKVFWNPQSGKFLGYRQAVDETGAPLFSTEPDKLGQPVPDKDQPVFEGELLIENIPAYNLKRKSGALTLNESPVLMVQNIMPKEDAEALVNSIPDPEEREKKLKMLTENTDTTYKTFDATSGEYKDAKNHVEWREYYFRPSATYPNGFFAMATPAGIIFSGEIPFGIYPIITAGFDPIEGSPRSQSIIKPLKASQAEINRMASMRATTQITMGRDLLVTQVGSKISKGQDFDGVRQLNINGPPPTVVPGRAGDQFAASLLEEVQDLYRLANLELEMSDKSIQDPNLQLYQSLSQKKKYAMYTQKFERFLCEIAELYLKLAKRYLPDTYLVKAIGKRDFVNIQEFKRIADEGFNIKLKPISSDIDSMFGKHLSIQAALQYGSSDMPASVKAKLIRSLPFIGDSRIVSEMTLTEENIENCILALDRGEFSPARLNDEHDKFVAALNHRMNQSDFKLLPPQVQEMYQVRIDQHNQLMAEQTAQLKAMQSEFIPTGGALVTCSVQIPDKATGKPKQLRLPYESLMHLVKILDSQGMSMDMLEQMDQQQQVDVLQKAAQLMNQPQAPASGQMQEYPPSEPLMMI